MIKVINELKILTKDISCEYKCRFAWKNVIQINGGITMNVDVSVKNIMYVKKIICGIFLHLVEKIRNILASINDNSIITCDEIIEEETKTVTTNFNETKWNLQKKFLNFTCLFINYYCIIDS